MEENEHFDIDNWMDVAQTVMAVAAAAHAAGVVDDIVAECCVIL